MASETGTQIRIHLQPNAKRDELVSFENGTLRVRIAAPPVEGKANKRLVDFLSEVLDISKSSITIQKGLASKEKRVEIRGLSPSELESRLGNSLHRR
ncbi:MAG: YggU family protein [Chloroflexi bacterium]|nr:YggU family protein [Chloroflexota bacterium]